MKRWMVRSFGWNVNFSPSVAESQGRVRDCAAKIVGKRRSRRASMSGISTTYVLASRPRQKILHGSLRCRWSTTESTKERDSRLASPDVAQVKSDAVAVNSTGLGAFQSAQAKKGADPGMAGEKLRAGDGEPVNKAGSDAKFWPWWRRGK